VLITLHRFRRRGLARNQPGTNYDGTLHDFISANPNAVAEYCARNSGAAFHGHLVPKNRLAHFANVFD
jgi:hypothetical protein